MAVEPRDLAALAEVLAGLPEEVALRSAASRAYYAAFHALLPVAECLTESPECKCEPTKISHFELSQRIGRWTPLPKFANLARLKVTAGAMQRQLRAARSTREAADYLIETTFDQATTKIQLGRCKALINFATQVKNEVVRSIPGQSSR